MPPVTTSLRQGAAALAAVILTVTGLAACSSTDSPEEHSTRLQKAAGLTAFQIDTSKDLWEKTSDQGRRNGQPLKIKAKLTDLHNGLHRVELTGVGLANYLRVLDYYAHGGANTDNLSLTGHHEAEAIRMYDEITKKLDAVDERPAAGAPPLRVVVDDAFVDSKP